MAKLKKRKLAVLEEHNTNEETSSENINEASELENQLGITNEESNPDENVIKSETLDLNDNSKTEQTATLDFTKQESLDDFIKKKTKKVEVVEDEEDDFKGKSQGDIRKVVEDAENNADDWSADDFYSVADIIITILDTFLANMMRIYAKDTKETEYTLNEKKRKLLVKQLAAILIKYQAKFKVEFLFLLSLILFYAAPFIAARRRRKRMKEIEKEVALARANGIPVEDAIRVAEERTNSNPEEKEIIEEAQYIQEEHETVINENLPLDLKKKKGRARRNN